MKLDFRINEPAEIRSVVGAALSPGYYCMLSC